jgi:uncharacterized protein (DUF302 family)
MDASLVVRPLCHGGSRTATPLHKLTGLLLEECDSISVCSPKIHSNLHPLECSLTIRIPIRVLVTRILSDD